MMIRAVTLAVLFSGFVGCVRPSQMPAGSDWHQFVVDRPRASGATGVAWRPDVCAGVDMRPDYRTLNESNLVAFLQSQQLAVRVERQPVEPGKPDLVFAFVTAPGGAQTIPLRVAMLKTPDEAGRDLYDAILEHGTGVWGVHRANVAVLGPPGTTEDDLAFAAKTRLACWGTFTIADDGDVVVIPGGYSEP
jgi:hypothetical protein